MGAAVALAAGLAVIALLQHETERLLDNARTHWVWLIAVALLGVAGGSAARITEPARLSPDCLRFSARVVSRMAAATLLGSAVMQRETFAWRVYLVRNVESPREAVKTLKESGLEARHVAGVAKNDRLEIDEPQGICNMFSRRTIVTQFPPAD